MSFPEEVLAIRLRVVMRTTLLMVMMVQINYMVMVVMIGSVEA
jgi:hypothetical protein